MTQLPRNHHSIEDQDNHGDQGVPRHQMKGANRDRHRADNIPSDFQDLNHDNEKDPGPQHHREEHVHQSSLLVAAESFEPDDGVESEGSSDSEDDGDGQRCPFRSGAFSHEREKV